MSQIFTSMFGYIQSFYGNRFAHPRYFNISFIPYSSKEPPHFTSETNKIK